MYVTRRLENDGARYFGPYTEVGAMRQALEVVKRLYTVRSCRYNLPDEAPARACLDYHIGRCRAPCVGLQSREEYRAIFHEARYNIALCRTRLAQAKTGAERAELLKQAELDITRTYQLYPKMGGPEWFEKYDALLKAIRKFRNQPNPKGLRDA